MEFDCDQGIFTSRQHLFIINSPQTPDTSFAADALSLFSPKSDFISDGNFFFPVCWRRAGSGGGVGSAGGDVYIFSLVNVCALIMARASPGVEKALQPAVGRHVSAVFLSGENSAVTHRVSAAAAAAPSAPPPQTKAPRRN